MALYLLNCGLFGALYALYLASSANTCCQTAAMFVYLDYRSTRFSAHQFLNHLTIFNYHQPQNTFLLLSCLFTFHPFYVFSTSSLLLYFLFFVYTYHSPTTNPTQNSTYPSPKPASTQGFIMGQIWTGIYEIGP